MEETAYRQFIELEQTHFWFVGRRRIFFHLLDQELDGRLACKVLDVGCGAGGMLGPLERYGVVSGIDTSPELVGVCRERGFERVEVGSVYQLPAASESIDLLTLFDTIEHVPDDLRGLSECHRVLKPGGILFVSVPAYQFLYANNDRVAHHQRRYTASGLQTKLRSAGFQPTKVTYFNSLLFPAILPAVLAKKLMERRTGPSERTNLSHRMPAPLNRTLAAIMGAERHLLARWRFPVGHSIIAIARRPQPTSIPE